MIRITVTILFLLIGHMVLAQDLHELCMQFNQLNTQVLHQKTHQTQAARELQRILSGISACKEIQTGNQTFVFPLKGYSPAAIGGKSGEGFISKGYNYFDGNNHKAHPAHDIFIRDKNQDQLDDITGKPVQVLSVSNGVVVACEKNWKPESKLRGGNYIWIFDAASQTLYYYAHNHQVHVSTGDQVKAGKVIATVGRTGLNACKTRSPTHLHFMVLRFNKTGILTPYNPYEQLLTARVIK